MYAIYVYIYICFLFTFLNNSNVIILHIEIPFIDLWLWIYTYNDMVTRPRWTNLAGLSLVEGNNWTWISTRTNLVIEHTGGTWKVINNTRLILWLTYVSCLKSFFVLRDVDIFRFKRCISLQWLDLIKRLKHNLLMFFSIVTLS